MLSKSNGETASATDGLNSVVYEKVKNLILERHVRPGVKLTHQAVAELLGVSRTPVREALERLLQEGYVHRLPRRGFFVSEIGPTEVQDLYETREALELFQLNRVFDRGFVRGEIAQLRGINQRYAKLIKAKLSYERLTVDREFHLKLASFGNNTVLQKTLESIFEKLILKRRLEGVSQESDDTPFDDHVRLIAAISESNRAQATGILQKHIRLARTRLLDHLRSFSAAEAISLHPR